MQQRWRSIAAIIEDAGETSFGRASTNLVTRVHENLIENGTGGEKGLPDRLENQEDGKHVI